MPEQPPAMLLGWFVGGADAEAISWLFREGEVEHPKQKYESKRAPGFSSQTKHRFMVFIKTLQARALLLLCDRVGPSSSRERRTATPSFSMEGNLLEWRWSLGFAIPARLPRCTFSCGCVTLRSKPL